MLPRLLKNHNLFNEGGSYLGLIKEQSVPKISHAMDDYRAGGMVGTIKIDNGLEAMELEMTLGGHESQFVRQMGAAEHDAVLLRSIGAYQSEDTGLVTAVEMVMRGRHQEIDRGTWKAGEAADFKVKSVLSYYKEIVNGRTLLEIDMARGIYIVGGIDRYAQIRAALGI